MKFTFFRSNNFNLSELDPSNEIDVKLNFKKIFANNCNTYL